MNIEEILKQELARALLSTPQVHKESITALTQDLASIPLRAAKGEDVSALIASLQAESAMIGVTNSIKAQLAAQEAWVKTIERIAITALITAL